MLKRNILLVFTILISVILANIFFFFNSRSFVSTYLINPLNSEVIFGSIKNFDAIQNEKKYKEIFNPKNVYKEVSNILTIKLYADLIRFLQNNKSYKYKFSKENNLSQKDEKIFFSVVKNINLEGAYFLNPNYLSIVKLQLFHNHVDDEKKLYNYIKFIITSELKNIINQSNTVLIEYSNELINLRQEFLDNNNIILDFIDYLELFFNFYNNKLYLPNLLFEEVLNLEAKKKRFLILQQDIKFLKNIAYEIRTHKSIDKENVKLMKTKLIKFLDFVEQNHIRLDLIENKSSIKNIIFNSNYFDELNSISNNEWFVHNSPLLKFDENNFDLTKIIERITQNFEFISRKFNLKELLALNIFSIIFGISIYYIFINFRKK